MTGVQFSTVCTVVTHYMKNGLLLLPFQVLWTGADQVGFKQEW